MSASSSSTHPRGAADVRTPLQADAELASQPPGWTGQEQFFMFTMCVGYVGVIMPVALTSVLIPALEEDWELNWEKSDSTVLLSYSGFIEALGQLGFAHLTDVVGGRTTLFVYTTVAITCLLLLSTALEPKIMLMIFMTMHFFKGTTFSAAIWLIGRHLPRVRWEGAVLCLATASRFGETFATFSFGSFLHLAPWRSAVRMMVGLTFLSFAIFNAMMGLQILRWPSRGDGHLGDEAASGVDNLRNNFRMLPDRLRVILRNPDYWLLLVMTLGLDAIYVFSHYFPAFARTMFDAPKEDAAQLAATYYGGEFLAPVLAALVSSQLGLTRRSLYCVILVMLGMSTVVPVAFLTLTVPLWAFACLTFLLGFLSVQAGYVPSSTFAITFGGRTGTVAFCSGCIDGISCMFGAILSLLVGRIREEGEDQGFRVLILTLLIGCMVSTTALASYVLRKWDTEFFAEEASTVGGSPGASDDLQERSKLAKDPGGLILAD